MLHHADKTVMDHKLTDAGGATMNLVNISGYPVCTFDRTPEEATRIVENIKRIECREDDIFILAPVKSGRRSFLNSV